MKERQGSCEPAVECAQLGYAISLFPHDREFGTAGMAGNKGRRSDIVDRSSEGRNDCGG